MNALVDRVQAPDPVQGGELGRSAYCRHIARHAPERPFRPPTAGA
ncbi:MAG: hypothetical protein Q8K96_18135 [Rubrivivax sp.]|nr:hypothetical protein [Rubrivivax sp.]